MVASLLNFFKIRATYVCCSIERVADTLIKQLPREKAQASFYYPAAVDSEQAQTDLRGIGQTSI